MFDSVQYALRVRAEKPVRILHGRENPSLEQHFLFFLYKDHDCVRRADNVVDEPEINLRPADPVEDVKRLESRGGHRFLNCGRGRFDSHGHPANELHSVLSSVGIVWMALGLDEKLPHLIPIRDIIAEQDLHRQDVAPRHDYKSSPTPHTPRSVKQIALGLRKRYADDPMQAILIMNNVFGCIEEVVKKLVVPRGPEFAAQFDYRKLFLLDGLMYGAEARFSRNAEQFEMSPQDVQSAIDNFRSECELALQAAEEDWMLGRRDVRHRLEEGQPMPEHPPWTFRDIVVATRTAKGVEKKTVTLAYGFSQARRAGAAARLDKADIVLQFSAPGKFTVSSNGDTLERPVAALRKADLEDCCVRLTAHDLLLLDRVGPCVMKDGEGNDVESFFFPEHRTGFGNDFDAKRGSRATRLSVEAIVALIDASLAEA